MRQLTGRRPVVEMPVAAAGGAPVVGIPNRLDGVATAW
jgi:hypothetical protein